MRNEPYVAYHLETFNLSTSMQTFSRTFTMDSPTDNNINFDFNLGGNTANTYIDSASLKKVNCGISPPSIQCECPAPAQPGNAVTVSNVNQLQNAISQARNQNGNMTIRVNPGVYQVNNTLVIEPNMTNLSIVGATGNRDDVFIKAEGPFGGINNVILVQADDFTVGHLTIGESSGHAIQIQAEQDADNFTAINVRFVDVLTQLLKVSRVEDGPDPFSDNGRVMCCAFEFTAGIAYQNYTGGIDAHRSKNWLVQNNTFKGIRSPDGIIAEHAIHFWRSSEGTMAIGNRIDNCDRGVGFGLTNPGDGHRGGLVMNNFIHVNRGVGIGLEHSPNTKVYNNTVINDNYSRSIEYRFAATTNVQILNNLVSGEISDRGENDGAGGYIDFNYRVFDRSIFANADNYDYHLVGTPAGIVDAGTPLSEVNVDIDCDNRVSGAGMDIGADEVSGGNDQNQCQQQGQTCNDSDNCTIGETYDANCNCTGGTYTDADGDGLCIGNDPDDNDPCNPNSCNSCNVFDDQDFESGWGIWNDGGSDARRSTKDASYANSGSRCVRLRDNSGSVSSTYTDALDMSAVTSVNVSFSYIANSMENNEDFFFEISTDGGTSYAIIQEWNAGSEFVNGTRYNETVTINQNFTDNTRFRFRCDASGNGDLIYIDDVLIEACGGTILPVKVEILPTSIAVNLYPNPANHSIQLDCEISENTHAQIQVYDNLGQLVKNMTNIELYEGTQTLNVDVSDLSTGMYFCTLKSDKWQTVKKFVIAR